MYGVGIIVHTMNSTGGSAILVGKEGVLLCKKYPNGLPNSNGISYLQGDIENTENIEYYHGSDLEEAEQYFSFTSQELSATLGLRIKYESSKSTENYGWYTHYLYLPQESRWTLPRLSSNTDEGSKAAVALLEELGFNIDKYSITYLFPVDGIKFFLRMFGAEMVQVLNGQHSRLFDCEFKTIEDCISSHDIFEPISRIAINYYDSMGNVNSTG